MFHAIPLKYVLPLLGLTVSAFIFNTSEFMPIGLLMDISQSFAMTESQTGIMITVYAWVVALLSLPLMLLVCQMEMRRLLLGTMGLFVLGQLASGLALNFPMLMAARIGVACAHSIFWSIAAPMATRLVTRTHRPLALSMIVTGSAVAMIFGLPLGRVIGLYAGWRMTFLVITVTALAVLIYLAFVFPKLASDASFSRDDLPKLLKNPVVISVYVLSVLFATAYFTAYSYIEPFLKTVAAFSDQGITSTLMLLGVSGLLGSFVFSRFYNHFRYGVIRAGLLGLVIPFLLWQAAAGRDDGRRLPGRRLCVDAVQCHLLGRTHPPRSDGGSPGGHVHLFGNLQRRYRRRDLDRRAGHGPWPAAVYRLCRRSHRLSRCRILLYGLFPFPGQGWRKSSKKFVKKTCIFLSLRV